MQWVFDKRRGVRRGRRRTCRWSSSGADALVGADNDALVALAAREVAAAIPGARAATLKRGTVIREKRATFSLAPGEPPRPGAETRRCAGSLLAGDWIDTGLPGTIESAVVSGHCAADASTGLAAISQAGARRRSSRRNLQIASVGNRLSNEVRHHSLPGNRAQGARTARGSSPGWCSNIREATRDLDIDGGARR